MYIANCVDATEIVLSSEAAARAAADYAACGAAGCAARDTGETEGVGMRVCGGLREGKIRQMGGARTGCEKEKEDKDSVHCRV